MPHKQTNEVRIRWPAAAILTVRGYPKSIHGISTGFRRRLGIGTSVGAPVPGTREFEIWIRTHPEFDDRKGLIDYIIDDFRHIMALGPKPKAELVRITGPLELIRTQSLELMRVIASKPEKLGIRKKRRTSRRGQP